MEVYSFVVRKMVKFVNVIYSGVYISFIRILPWIWDILVFPLNVVVDGVSFHQYHNDEEDYDNSKKYDSLDDR